METVQDLLTDKFIDIVWGNADFGDGVSKRNVIANSLLKCACGYTTGHTARHIMEDLGLVTKGWVLTVLGKRYLFAAYSGGLSV